MDFLLKVSITAMITPGAVDPIAKKTIGRSAKKYVKVAPRFPPITEPKATAHTKLATQTMPRAYLTSVMSPPSAARFYEYDQNASEEGIDRNTFPR